jgi:hypothetical protein
MTRVAGDTQGMRRLSVAVAGRSRARRTLCIKPCSNSDLVGNVRSLELFTVARDNDLHMLLLALKNLRHIFSRHVSLLPGSGRWKDLIGVMTTNPR